VPKLYFDLEQGSADWYRIRSGIPTASEFHSILTPAKMQLSTARHKYAARLIAGRLLNWQADSLEKIDHIRDGKEQEPFAIAQMELVNEIKTRKLGFATTNDGRFGASPDRVVMSGDAVSITAEAKCPTIPVQMERLLFGHGSDYAVQVAGQLWVCEADKAIFYSFNPRTPPYMVETGRDEVMIKKLSDALEQFSDELEALTEKARSLGMFQAFAEIVTPAEAELSGDELAAFLDGGGDAVDLRGMA
jgi:hypothetical protein